MAFLLEEYGLLTDYLDKGYEQDLLEYFRREAPSLNYFFIFMEGLEEILAARYTLVGPEERQEILDRLYCSLFDASDNDCFNLEQKIEKTYFPLSCTRELDFNS